MCGDDNLEFNEGKKFKYAYKVDKVYKLKKPIDLATLKEKFEFIPLQGYAYKDRYLKLTNYI